MFPLCNVWNLSGGWHEHDDTDKERRQDRSDKTTVKNKNLSEIDYNSHFYHQVSCHGLIAEYRVNDNYYHQDEHHI